MLSGTTDFAETCDSARWDDAIARLNGDLLQSWRWGEFKQRHGWNVERIHIVRPDGEAIAQLLFRRRGPFSLGYLPRGPLIEGGEMVAATLLEAIDEISARHRAIVLVVEPDRAIPQGWIQNGIGFADGPESFQTSHTVKVVLASDEDLLAQMRKDTRYNVSYARRQGVEVEFAGAEPAAISTFYQLLQETSERNAFGIHDREYYDDFLRVFDDRAVLLFSRTDGVPTSALIAARSGDEGRSMYAGSSTEYRGRGDAALLRFETMRWARDHGCARFDLGGIASEAPPGQRGSDGEGVRRGPALEGVRQFKVGFGGEIIAYQPTVERRYHPRLAWLVRRINARFRPAHQRSQASATNEFS